MKKSRENNLIFANINRFEFHIIIWMNIAFQSESNQTVEKFLTISHNFPFKNARRIFLDSIWNAIFINSEHFSTQWINNVSCICVSAGEDLLLPFHIPTYIWSVFLCLFLNEHWSIQLFIKHNIYLLHTFWCGDHSGPWGSRCEILPRCCAPFSYCKT